MEEEIKVLIGEYSEAERSIRKSILDQKKHQEFEAMMKDQPKRSQVSKFDSSKHVGTVYDEKLGRRVPVSNPSDLPTLKSPNDILSHLNWQSYQK